ncbi:MAG: alpha/beta hydrolase [Gammaproteobacteria bacterium]|nr:alpha/beta hydrolase [Gammaproteobacteria bacterium]
MNIAKTRSRKMNYFYFFIRTFCFYSILQISACSTYNQATHQYVTENFSKLSPHYVPTQQGQIEYYISGSGTPILLIPGYATDVSSWNSEFLAALAQHHQIIIPNNRNVGGSHILSASYQTEDLANDTYQLIQKVRLKKPTVIGISMGGMIAQQLAVLHPNALSHLILINTSIAGKHAVQPTPAVQKKLLGLSKYKLGFYVSAIDLFFPPSWKMQMSYSLIVNRFKPQHLTEIDPGSIMPQQQHLIRHWLDDNATAKKISELHMPVLILNGQSDIVIPPVNSVILANAIHHAQLIRWKDGGHAMIYQYPQEMANNINDFITAN